ncbi:MAG: SUF system Fe-S cluster assembly regulator [Alphaproteobacteria bacterium]|nr:SUF system Fe-S cluster assembly regulator [Alphaproteobacteria bacterium]
MIKLSKMTDYAVVVLAEMALHAGVRMSASHLAQSTKLPEPTVSKILKLLAKHNLVISRRGVNGGYLLSKSPDEIDMAAVITALDGPIALTACVEGSKDCCEYKDMCAMKGQWNPVNMAMRNALRDVSLAQMIGGKVNG